MSNSPELQKALDFLRFARPNARLFHLIRMVDELDESDWLIILGKIWTSCNNLADAMDVIYHDTPFANRDGVIREMMLDTEWNAYLELPERLTIYRGCYEGLNEDGLSFSLDESIARKFPFYSQYRQPNEKPILLVCEVDKDRISAYKQPDHENEIITKTWKVVDQVDLNPY